MWARTHGADGRSPLMTAAALSLNWTVVEPIFDGHQIEIYEKDDAVTGMVVSMLAAVGPSSDLESVYRLCVEHPPALMLPLMVRDDECGIEETQISGRKRKK